MKRIDPILAGIAAASVGIALLVGVGPALSIVIGLVTLGAGAVGASLQQRREPPPPPTPVEPLHPDEERWMTMAGDAVIALERGIGTLDDGPLQARLTDVAARAEDVLRDLYRVAAQVAATRRASNRLDEQQLAADLARLTSDRDGSDDADVVHDLERSVDAVREQLRISRRMATARAGLQARIEAGTLGLQQLAAQVGEMAALAPPGGGSWSQGELIDELTARLDALRAGLGDAAVMSRRALGTMDTEGDNDASVDA